MNERKAILTCSTKYTSSPLKFPSDDVDAIASVLKRRCKFKEDDIKKIVHQNRCEDNSFIENLKKICSDIDEEKKDTYELIVFYYSGHGIYKEEEQTSFIEISDGYTVSIKEIMEIISTVKSKNRCFIIDACQSGGFSLEMTPKRRKVDRTHIYHSKGTYCMFGSTKNKLSYEPSSNKNIKNSYYTHFIVEALDTRTNYIDDVISIKAVDDYISKKTSQYTGFDQITSSVVNSDGYLPFGYWDEELEDIGDWNKSENNSEIHLDYQEDNAVNYLVEQIKQFFNSEGFFPVWNITDPLKDLSQPAIDHLNKKLGLTNKQYNGKPLINGLLSANHKHNFLSFILREPNVYIDINHKDTEGRTALVEAIYTDNDNDYIVNDMIRDLFIKGYKLNEDEKNTFRKQIIDRSVNGKQIDRIVVAFICNTLKEENLIRKSKKIEKIMFSFFSFRLPVVVHYKGNRLSIANNFLEHYKDFSRLFIKALHEYGYYDEFKTKDSFIKKVSIINKESPYQKDDYDDVLYPFFPELFKK